MSKKVEISQELFLRLCKYHLGDKMDEKVPICNDLTAKLDALVNREVYSRSKDKTLSPEERETARKEYLDRRGISNDFRW